MSGSFEGGARARVAARQRLYVRLLHCVATAQAFAQDPAPVLARFGLGEQDLSKLPKTDAPQHLAEMHGRRILIANELMQLGEAFRLLLGDTFHPGELARSDWFLEFLSSDEFYSPAASLPDAYGLGRGYEGISRFFFWARARWRSEPCDGWREALHRSFALWLLMQARVATDPEYRRFGQGYYWRQRPGRRNSPFSVVASGGSLVELDGSVRSSQLRRLGLLNLDQLTPGVAA